MTALSRTALALVIVGAINWVLVGLLRFNWISAIFGNMSLLSRIVHVLVGLAGIYCIRLLAVRRCRLVSAPAEEHRRAA